MKAEPMTNSGRTSAPVNGSWAGGLVVDGSDLFEPAATAGGAELDVYGSWPLVVVVWATVVVV